MCSKRSNESGQKSLYQSRNGFIEDAVVLADFEDFVHEVGDVLGGEDLSGVGFLFVAVEFVEEDAHDVFAAPFVGVDAVGDVDDAVDEVVDGGLVSGGVHADGGVFFDEDFDFGILAFAGFEGLVEGFLDVGVEGVVAEVFQFP